MSNEPIKIKLMDYVDKDATDTFAQGAEFRHSHLGHLVEEAVSEKRLLFVDLDGAYGYTANFLKGAFAGSTGIPKSEFLELVRFFCQDQPGLPEEVVGYIRGLSSDENLKSSIINIDVLGSPWIIKFRKLEEDTELEVCDGYTDKSIREIVIRKHEPEPAKLRDLEAYERKVMRHEIVHAFLHESGLAENSKPTDAWACNEEMIDWMAIQGPKIHLAWQHAKAL